MSSWWLPHKGWGGAHLFTRHIWLGFLPLVLNYLGNDWHRKARRALSGLSLTRGSIDIHLLLSRVYFSFFIFWISAPPPHSPPPASSLSLPHSSPWCCRATRKYSNPPQHSLKGHVLESCPWFCSALLKRMEALGQGWLSPPLQGVSPFGLEATAVLPLLKSQDGGWGLKPTLLKAPGLLFSLVLLLGSSLSLWTLFHLEWVFKLLTFALKVSLLWTLVEISIIFLFIGKEWVGTKNTTFWIFFFFSWSPEQKDSKSSKGGGLAPLPRDPPLSPCQHGLWDAPALPRKRPRVFKAVFLNM